jgi:hypothetical protein
VRGRGGLWRGERGGSEATEDKYMLGGASLRYSIGALVGTFACASGTVGFS